MRNPLLRGSLMIAIGGVSLCARAEELSKTDVNEIRLAYRAMARSFEVHDPEQSRRYFSSDFVETREGSSSARTLEEFLRELRAESERALPPVRVRLTPTRFKVDGGELTIRVDELTRYRIRAEDGKVHTIEYRQRSEDHWLKEAGAWKCKREVDERFPYETKIDGRSVTFQTFTELLR